MEGASNLHACPYIGLSSDASISRLVATSAHRCHRWATPQTVEKEHQVSFCLNDNHINCPWFVRPGSNFSSRREHYNPVSRKQRVVGVAALLSVLILLFVAVRMFVWPAFFGGDQEKLAGAPTEATATSPTVSAPAAPTTSQPSPSAAATSTQPTTAATPSTAAAQPTTLPVAAQPTAPTPMATGEASTAVATPPAATPSPTVRPQATPSNGERVYEVKSGDTLYGLAITFGVTVEDIMEANGLTDRASLQVGQKLIIPPAD